MVGAHNAGHASCCSLLPFQSLKTPHHRRRSNSSSLGPRAMPERCTVWSRRRSRNCHYGQFVPKSMLPATAVRYSVVDEASQRQWPGFTLTGRPTLRRKLRHRADDRNSQWRLPRVALRRRPLAQRVRGVGACVAIHLTTVTTVHTDSSRARFTRQECHCVVLWVRFECCLPMITRRFWIGFARCSARNSTS
jgi:hypothetical protein